MCLQENYNIYRNNKKYDTNIIIWVSCVFRTYHSWFLKSLDSECEVEMPVSFESLFVSLFTITASE
jgi:hypothetical protein